MRFRQRSDGVHQTLRFSLHVGAMENEMPQTNNRRARRRRRTVMPAVAGWARGALLVIALAGISSCDRSPAAPSPAAEQPVTLSRVRIDGPTLVAPGDSPRYMAIAEYSDGSSKDVTATASWFPNAESFPIHFTSPGIAAPARRGEATVSARTPGRLADSPCWCWSQARSN